MVCIDRLRFRKSPTNFCKWKPQNCKLWQKYERWGIENSCKLKTDGNVRWKKGEAKRGTSILQLAKNELISPLHPIAHFGFWMTDWLTDWLAEWVKFCLVSRKRAENQQHLHSTLKIGSASWPCNSKLFDRPMRCRLTFDNWVASGIFCLLRLQAPFCCFWYFYVTPALFLFLFLFSHWNS